MRIFEKGQIQSIEIRCGEKEYAGIFGDIEYVAIVYLEKDKKISYSFTDWRYLIDFLELNMVNLKAMYEG